MNFSVRLDADQVSVDPGDKAPLAIEVINNGPTTDQFEISVEGLDLEWTAIPVPSFSVGAGATVREAVFFQPPRVSESLAAAYPFTVRVRSLESGEQRVLPAVLHVKPYTHLSMEILPKKGVFSPVVRENSFQSTVINLGNSEQNLQLFGSDPDEALAYAFEPEHISIGPGHQKDIEVTATPIHTRPLGGARLHGFTISARNPEQANISCAAQAQLEQKPLLSPGSIAVIAAFLILVFGWLSFAPKPPVVDVFSADVTDLKEGDKYTLTWRSSNAKSVRILFNDKEIVSAAQPDGSQQFVAVESGTYSIEAIRETRKSDRKEVEIRVTKVIPLGPAVIGKFSLDPSTVEPGEPVMVRYEVTGATELILSPDGLKLGTSVTSHKVLAPEREGPHEYQLIALNGDGLRTESSKIRLTVRRAPKVSIVSFSAEPETIDVAVAKTKLVWQTKGARRVEIRFGDFFHESTEAIGSLEIDAFKSGDCELTAYDEDGLSTKKTIRLTVRAAEPPADDTKTTGATGATGSTGTTGTTSGAGNTGTTGTTGTPPLTNAGGGRR